MRASADAAEREAQRMQVNVNACKSRSLRHCLLGCSGTGGATALGGKLAVSGKSVPSECSPCSRPALAAPLVAHSGQMHRLGGFSNR
jgi:hypothetical protein